VVSPPADRRREALFDLLALTAGGALPLAFAPYAWRPLAVLCPLLLFYCWHRAAPRRAAWRGWLFGLGYFGVGVHWVYYSVHLFGDAAAPLAGLVAAGFVLLLAMFPALAGWLATRLFPAPRRGVWWLLAAPMLWLLVEWSRSWVLTGFPWLSLGYAGLDTPLAGYAPLLGSYAVGAALAASAGALGWLLLARGARRWAAALLLLAIWGGGLALHGRQWTQPVGQPLDVRLVQGNFAQHQKFLGQLLRPALRSYAQMTEAGLAADLTIWPETAVPARFDRVAVPLQAVAERAAARGGAVLAGGFYRQPDGRYHNSLWLLGSQQVYHKRHLVPFGEYMPFRALLEFLSRYILIPMSDLAPGEGEPRPLQLAGQQIAASICYEAAFGAEIIRQLPAATLLVNVSNDGWFGDSLAPHQHLEMARMRALETGREMLRATNTGISAIIAADGGLRSSSEQFRRSALDGVAHGYRGATPYVRGGDLPVVLFALAALLAALPLQRRFAL